MCTEKSYSTDGAKLMRPLGFSVPFEASSTNQATTMELRRAYNELLVITAVYMWWAANPPPVYMRRYTQKFSCIFLCIRVYTVYISATREFYSKVWCCAATTTFFCVPIQGIEPELGVINLESCLPLLPPLFISSLLIHVICPLFLRYVHSTFYVRAKGKLSSFKLSSF